MFMLALNGSRLKIAPKDLEELTFSVARGGSTTESLATLASNGRFELAAYRLQSTCRRTHDESIDTPFPLLRRVAAGEDVVIAKAGRPVARLVPLAVRRASAFLGSQRGKFVVPEDFDAPLPEEILAEFER